MALDPVSAVLDIGGKLIDRLWPDPTKAAEAKLELIKLQQSGELSVITGQLEINKVEAANTSWFVAGWRPYIGWICGTGLGYEFLLRPLANGLLGDPSRFIGLDTGTLLTLLIGMLGLGTMRTYEKATGAEGNR